jgi:hypothetical protein
MGLPPWTPAAFVRAAAGWVLDWGERVTFEVLSFRAELWCADEGLLVSVVWKHAQRLPGITFAARSRQMLVNSDVPEIFDMPGWAEFVDERMPALPAYKSFLRRTFERSSTQAWVNALRALPMTGAHLYAQLHVVSVGDRLMELGRLDLLHAAADFDLFRLGVLRISTKVPGGRHRRCIMCGSCSSGMDHLLASCTAGDDARWQFVTSVDRAFAASLGEALEGDWSPTVLSPHLEPTRLVAAVRFVAELVFMLRPMQS